MSKPIELMHVYFGENKNTCGTCCNLVEVIRGKKKLRKCKAYGGFHSSKADWAKKWVACGLYGEHVPQPMVSDTAKQIFYRVGITQEVVPFPVSWTVKMKKKQKETQDILSYHSQAAGCSDKTRAKASGGRQPIEECGRTGL